MSETISFKDFQKLDIRVGTIIKAEVPDWSHWVMKLTVDVGEEKPRTIFAGLMHYAKPEEIKGKQFPFLLNLEPKKIGPKGDYSEGMMLALDGKLKEPILVEDEKVFDKPVFLNPAESVPPGTSVR